MLITDELVKALQKLFRRKMEEVYEKTAGTSQAGAVTYKGFNAWHNYLTDTLSLEVVDIEEGEKPGALKRGGRQVAVRIINPSNEGMPSKEFVIVPIELAVKALALQDVPDTLN